MYPNLKAFPEIDIAITLGESKLIPSFVKGIIDIGNGVVDLSTLVDLLSCFNLLNNETMDIMAQYAAAIIPQNQGLQAAMRGLINLKDLFAKSLNNVGDAVITYDEKGHITLFNQIAESIFSCLAPEVIGQEINSFLHEKGIKKFLPAGIIQEQLIQIRQQDIILNRQSIESNEKKLVGS